MMFRYIFVLCIFCAVISSSLTAQNRVYELNIGENITPIIEDNLDFEGVNPEGTTFSVNNRYFERNGEPWFPLMGEFHYIRYPEQYWEEEIVKMKSAGLSIVATYVFWNAHEHPKGVWNWDGIRDLRQFVELCHKHDMFVWLRIGPWSHGEQLHGGHPDWINGMKGKRSNNPEYLAEANKLFGQIATQVKGLYFKDGGPILGVQLENEYASGDVNHIGTLKTMAIKAGIQPVYFTITGNSVFHDDEFEAIPLQGAYPYRGWETRGGKATKDFLYGNDQWILTDALGKVYYDVTKYPKGLCEQGCGSQMTYRNRFIVEPHVVEAHLQNQIGRGMNLVGYYMFQGGTQLPGLKEPGCPESYDFQAPISEFGLLRPSYKYLKVLHSFVRDFGSDLATMKVVEPSTPVKDELNTVDLRYVARVAGKSGFLFLNNTQVRVPMPDKEFQVRLNFEGETLTFPRKSLRLKGEATAILPFNMDIEGALLKYATVQPIAQFQNDDTKVLFFTKVPGMDVELAFDKSTVQQVKGSGWDKEINGDVVYVNIDNPKEACLDVKTNSGKKVKMVMLTRQQAEQCWRTTINNQEVLIISNADVMFYNDHIKLRQLDDTEFNMKVFPEIDNLYVGRKKVKTIKGEIFETLNCAVEAQQVSLDIADKNDGSINVAIQSNALDGLSDIIVDVDYLGSNAEAWVRGKNVTDHLYNGTKWQFGLKRYLKNKELQVHFKANEWKDNITGVDEKLVREIKNNTPKIKSIKAHPQYQLKLSWKK
ncbi:hypothetical protein EYV94_09715 [Puteibacter caeruleilacunae]|nr:hypothetical protein EYV94_09715 [Puteibacter caeruleilacunae]